MDQTKIKYFWVLLTTLVIIGYADDAKDIKKLKKDVKKLKKEDKKIIEQLEALNTNYEVFNQTLNQEPEIIINLQGDMPNHIAIILDGNRRWAKRNLTTSGKLKMNLISH